MPRIALLLTIALLPIGIIAVAQTNRAMDAARDSYRGSLAAKTSALAAPDREAILSAFGLARGLAEALVVLAPTDPDCSALMRQIADRNPRFTFVGFIDRDAVSRCNHAGDEHAFTDTPRSQRLFANPEPNVLFNPAGQVSGAPVMIVSEPVYGAENAFRGFMSIAFRGQTLDAARRAAGIDGDAVMVSFNSMGEILTADVPRDEVEEVLPANTSLAGLVGTPDGVFAAENAGGERRLFALTAIVPERAYALASWPPYFARETNPLLERTTLAFPLLMWLVSLAVALLAIQRQVIRPIGSLGRRMRSFADGRRVLPSAAMANAPRELRDIGETFQTMADKIIRDEADLENAVHEREALLKEVHHRVKNNLQLMSSILNMQSRRADSPEAGAALRDVQDRLTSLAIVHRGLYQSPELARIRADTLLDELIRQRASMSGDRLGSVALDLDFDYVLLKPDQANPLAMLATETFSNAVKYVGPDAEGRSRIAVSLRCVAIDEGDEITFEIENTVGPDAAADGPPGLGLQLIAAFAQQLDARLAQRLENGLYRVSVSFVPGPHAVDCTETES